MKPLSATKAPSIFNNQKGQGLIEYMILVALIAVASIGVTMSMQETLTAKLTTITHKLQGRRGGTVQADQVQESQYRKKDLSDFMQGSAVQD